MRLLRPAIAVLAFGLCVSFAAAQTREELRAKAKEASKKIADIVAEGPDASEQSLKLLQELVDQLKQLNAALKAAPAEAPKPKVAISGYLQAQFQTTNRNSLPNTGPADAFRIRRSRLNVDFDPRPRIRVRLSIDSEGGVNEVPLRLREAYARYTTPEAHPLIVTAGQQAVPIGYDIERSSFEHEFPERNATARTYFDGEFTPGFRLDKQLGRGWTVTLGGFNDQTVSDPEQNARYFRSGGELVFVGAITNEGRDGRIRLSGMGGHRSAYVDEDLTLPKVERSFLAADGSYRRGPVTFRGEVIAGRDRVPLRGTEDKPLLGWHALVNYDLNLHNSVAFRYQTLDRNRHAVGDSLFAYGLSYTWRLDKDLKVTLSHELFEDSARSSQLDRHYTETVLRLGIRF